MKKQSVAIENNIDKINNFKPKNAQKTKFFIFFRYFLIFFAFYILNRAGINGEVYPFAFSFLCVYDYLLLLAF